MSMPNMRKHAKSLAFKKRLWRQYFLVQKGLQDGYSFLSSICACGRENLRLRKQHKTKKYVEISAKFLVVFKPSPW